MIDGLSYIPRPGEMFIGITLIPLFFSRYRHGDDLGCLGGPPWYIRLIPLALLLGWIG